MSDLRVGDVGQAADWFELMLLASSRSRLGLSRIEATISQAAPDLSEDQVELATDDVLVEVERRADLSGGLYPFERRSTGLFKRSVSDAVQLLYIFLALSSVYGAFRKPRVGLSPGRIFERVTAAALRVWCGGHAIVFADTPPEGGSTLIRAAISRLGQTLGVTSYPQKARAARKDHGLDVVAFRPFADRRAAHPVLLCQCTLGWNLIAKAREISFGEWGGLLDVREATFSAGLAVPHALAPDYPHWDEVRRNTDLILERTRLLRLLEPIDDPASDVVPHQAPILEAFREWAEVQA